MFWGFDPPYERPNGLKVKALQRKQTPDLPVYEL